MVPFHSRQDKRIMVEAVREPAHEVPNVGMSAGEWEAVEYASMYRKRSGSRPMNNQFNDVKEKLRQ